MSVFKCGLIRATCRVMMLIDADVSVAERKGDRGYWLHVRQSL